MENSPVQGVVLGLDIGDARIGVARAHSFARLPEPLEVIDRKKVNPLERLKTLVKQHEVKAFIVGLPVYPSGDEGPQAAAVKKFVQELSDDLGLPCIFTDESFTSQEADAYLKSKQWQGQTSNDAVAACLILERYFTEKAHV